MTGPILSLRGREVWEQRTLDLIPYHELEYPDKEERGRGWSKDREKDRELGAQGNAARAEFEEQNRRE